MGSGVMTIQMDMRTMLIECLKECREELASVFSLPQPMQIEKPVSQRELCEFLDTSEQTLIKWREKGKIPFLRLGSKIMYLKSEVLEAIRVDNKKKGRNN